MTPRHPSLVSPRHEYAAAPSSSMYERLHVLPPSDEAHSAESRRHYMECFGLSWAQQLKNKDIPEGGSKAVCLVTPQPGGIPKGLGLVRSGPHRGRDPADGQVWEVASSRAWSLSNTSP